MAVFYVIVIWVIFGIIYIKLRRHYTYWDRKGVKGPKPCLLIGNLKTASYTKSIVSECYKQYPEEKYVGIYEGLSPALIIRDPRLVKEVFIKDFPSFANRGYSVIKEPILKNLIFEDGANWSILRQRLTPIFTSGKLRQMMPLLNRCVGEYINYVNGIVERENTHEIRDINGRYTLKGIICCAFGLDINTFSEEGKEFTEAGDKLLNVSLKVIIMIFIDNLIPGLLTKLNIKLVNRNVTDFFFNLTRKMIKEREGKPKVRRDFMDLMIEMKEEGSVTKSIENGNAELEITDEVIVAQAIVFYVAGFETSSGVMSFLFYELALSPSIQERCYLEIKEVIEKYNGELTYDAVKELKYVSMALDEALRKYPATPRLARKSTAEYTFPGTNLTIEKDVRVIVPVLALHKDPKFFPDPEKFDPERFAPENKHKIQDCTYLPFGEGPRKCIGMRFAQVLSLLGIAHFLYNFRLQPSEKTPEQITYTCQALTLTSERSIWLNVTRR